MPKLQRKCKKLDAEGPELDEGLEVKGERYLKTQISKLKTTFQIVNLFNVKS